MKKRITRADWEYIGKYNPAAKWLRPLASYSLIEIEGGYRREWDVVAVCEKWENGVQ